MKKSSLSLAVLTALIAAALIGCTNMSPKVPDISAGIRASLENAGFKDVSVTQDREKGVVTLGGHVPADGDKSQADAIARNIARDLVVSNQIAVQPPGGESEAKSVNLALDKGIESNLEAALIVEKLRDSVKSAVKNQVVTLTGVVHSPSTRSRAQDVASRVPNVRQVVNELQVSAQKASSSN